MDFHAHYKNKEITYNEAELLIYSQKRNQRFEVFITLFDATLKDSPTIAYKVFREAYCVSDNIYKQIINSPIQFNLKKFLNYLQSEKVDFYNLMREEEKKFYKDLPNYFDIYRGMNILENQNSEYGISWSLSKKEAENYIYFDQNETEQGGLAKKNISKKDVLTVFSVHGKMEIIYVI